jgi:hypothetical protein
MPAQVCHLMFAEELLQAAAPEAAGEVLEHHGKLFRFAAQGPDFFYHNQRTLPTGMKYGVSAHRHSYGRLVAHMIAEFRHLHDGQRISGQRAAALGEIESYILGFTTHAFLDRKTHPYIDYHAGWSEFSGRRSDPYYRCHIFLERILDVLMLKEKRGLRIDAIDLPSLLDCGDMLPYGVVKTLTKSLHLTYPRTHYKSRDRQRIENAYRDTIAFYAFTDARRSDYRRAAVERDLVHPGDHHRRLALFHPVDIPDSIDFLNLGKHEWAHPCNQEWRYTASFPELYAEALEQAVPVMRRIQAILRGSGAAEEAEAIIGNESLNTGLPWPESGPQRFSAPLPLPELLDEMYRTEAARIGLSYPAGAEIAS